MSFRVIRANTENESTNTNQVIDSKNDSDKFGLSNSIGFARSAYLGEKSRLRFGTSIDQFKLWQHFTLHQGIDDPRLTENVYQGAGPITNIAIRTSDFYGTIFMGYSRIFQLKGNNHFFASAQLNIATYLISRELTQDWNEDVKISQNTDLSRDTKISRISLLPSLEIGYMFGLNKELGIKVGLRSRFDILNSYRQSYKLVRNRYFNGFTVALAFLE
jgi:hypothetical protein